MGPRSAGPINNRFAHRAGAGRACGGMAGCTKNIARVEDRRAGCSWGLALWVSLYEPLVLLVIVSRLLPGALYA